MLYQFKTNINCGSCVKSVSRSLDKLEGIRNWKVDTNNADKILSVELEDFDVDVIIEAVKTAGFEIEQI